MSISMSVPDSGSLATLREALPDARRPDEARLRVLVLSPLRFFAEALAAELSRFPHLDAWVWPGFQAETPPDVLLVEVHPPHGLHLLRHWRDRFPAARIIALGVEERPEQVLECIESGAVGYVPSDAIVPELVAVIERASRGEALCAPAVAGQLFRRVAGLARDQQIDPLAEALLTPREREVAGMLGRGLSNKAIARQLGVRVPTVKTHVHQVLRKLGTSSRVTLLAVSGRHALASTEDLDPLLDQSPPGDR